MEKQENEVKVTSEYLKKNAVKTPYAPEGSNLSSDMITQLLPDMHKICINRSYETKDPVILEWYYKLAQHGQFGTRVAHLMALDAYGRIPETSNITEMSTDDKINQLVGTVTHITNMLMRTQKMTESNMTTQAKSINFLKSVALNVKTQGAILEAIEAILSSDNTYSPDDVRTVIDGIKDALKDK